MAEKRREQRTEVPDAAQCCKTGPEQRKNRRRFLITELSVLLIISCKVFFYLQLQVDARSGNVG